MQKRQPTTNKNISKILKRLKKRIPYLTDTDSQEIPYYRSQHKSQSAAVPFNEIYEQSTPKVR